MREYPVFNYTVAFDRYFPMQSDKLAQKFSEMWFQF